MGELGALFNPGMRHELEERQAKAARREEEGNAKDGDLRIDLESGVAVINMSAGDGTVSSDDSTVSDEDGTVPDANGAVSDEDGTVSDGNGAATAGVGAGVGAEGSVGQSGSDSQTSRAPVADPAEAPVEARPAASKSPSRSARAGKSGRGAGSPEKPVLQPRGKRGATAAR